MTCTTCNTEAWDALDDRTADEMAGHHVAMGSYPVQCPECGEPVWPWELPPPDLGPATGLRWVRNGPSWTLYDGDGGVGAVVPCEPWRAVKVLVSEPRGAARWPVVEVCTEAPSATAPARWCGR